MANKMAAKKKNTSQNPTRSQSPTRSQGQMAEPKVRSDVKEPSKTVKTVAREQNDRKGQEGKSVRSQSKAPSSWQIRLRNNRTVRFIFDAYYELRHKVTWPSFNEARNMTIAVILISVAVGFVLFVVDQGLYQLFLLVSRLGGH